MFLSSVQPTITNFDFVRDHGVSIEKTAVEAELSYLADFDARDLTVDMTGHYLVLEGTVTSAADAERAVKVAREIVGSDRVMSRLVVVQPATALI
ncbi:BON domain-containing protein [Neorhizobium lilium]|nr:BON domain-containing protein [Neorhizobium lilium]